MYTQFYVASFALLDADFVQPVELQAALDCFQGYKEGTF
jgi:hypothetical protein